jgi:hypothetical protein
MSLLCHYGLLRGERARGLELADLFPLELKNEGPSACIAVVMVLRQVYLYTS